MKKLLSVVLIYFGLIPFFSQTTVNYFVSATGGSDTQAGCGVSWTKPYATIEKALDVIITAGGTSSTTYNVYVAQGSYAISSAKTFYGSYSVNLYGGYPVPTASTPPTDVCIYNVVTNPTTFAIPTTLTNSPFRLQGDGGTFSVN